MVLKLDLEIPHKNNSLDTKMEVNGKGVPKRIRGALIKIKGLEHQVRSLRLEAPFFLQLKNHNIQYDYEPKTFTLPCGKHHITYRPDCRIKNTNIWIECKGVFDDISIIKMMCFKKYFKNKYKLFIVAQKQESIKWVPRYCFNKIYSIDSNKSILKLVSEINKNINK